MARALTPNTKVRTADAMLAANGLPVGSGLLANVLWIDMVIEYAAMPSAPENSAPVKHFSGVGGVSSATSWMGLDEEVSSVGVGLTITAREMNITSVLYRNPVKLQFRRGMTLPCPSGCANVAGQGRAGHQQGIAALCPYGGVNGAGD